MPQDQDALRKVGRGGAGNYYPSKQADEAFQDIEAQKAHVSASAPLSSSAHGPARGGRGGAGNFVDPAQQTREQGRLAEETAAAVISSLKKHPPRGVASGRGGAGNYDNETVAEPARRREEEERSKATELERKVKEAVEMGLKLPERVYHGSSKYEP